MLTVFRSNRAEHLAQVLATQLRESPPPPFETVEVVVNTWPTSRWLGEQLANHLGGIAANIRYPFPGSKLRQVVQQVLGEAPAGRDPWRATDLVWPVLELLPALVAEPQGAPLRDWLGRRGARGLALDRAQWQLARSVADALDDYALYRPELLESWWAGQDDGQDWQPLLVRRLAETLGTRPFGLKVRDAITRLTTDPAAVPGLPTTLRLFGLSSMAPIQVQLLQALSGRVLVDLYLLTPCPDLWQRCVDRRAALSDAVALQQPLEGDWLVDAPPGLEARFGRLGAEFQQLLEGGGEYQLGRSTELDLFTDPLGQGRLEASGGAPLLLQLQRQLLAPEAAAPLQRLAGDCSLEFHPCPGRLRQVQIVRDRILQLLHANPELQPRDVLVMTPQVEVFAPLIASVFGDRDATGVALDWRLTDRSQQSQAGLGRSLLTLLCQAGERLTASGLETLLESAPLRQRFQLSAEEITTLHRTLQQVGFRWGLDSADRGGEGDEVGEEGACGSLSWAMDRLLLGLVLPEVPGLAPGGAAPFGTGHSLELVGRWLHLLTRLRHWLQALLRPRRCPDWRQTLQDLIEDLFGDGGDQAWELPSLLAALDDWQQAAAGCDLLLEAPVVAAVLDERLAADAGRFGHRSGALTISALEPMRAIPHRVIVLMGLDAGCFPRRRHRPGFHQLERQRQLGDPSPADQDRYVLLEALLSAREHLLVTWNCRDERKGEGLWPATPVSQWLAWLTGQLGGTADGLEIHHPANPLDRRNFLPTAERPAASCDQRLLEARRLLERPSPPAPPQALAGGPALAQPPLEGGSAGGEGGEPFALLRAWILAPQVDWLRSLGLHPKEWAEAIHDLDATDLDERQRSRLLRESLQWATEGEGATEAAQAATPDQPQAWLERQRGHGLLPPHSGGALEASLLAERWGDLQAALLPLGPPRRQEARWGAWHHELSWWGHAVVVVHTAKVRARHRLDLWLQLLLAAAAGQDPAAGVLVARGDKAFGIQLRLTAPAPAAAQAELERLAELRDAWRQHCWPVPPNTGWALLDGDADKAIACWEGSEQAPAERREPEQALCFGAELPGELLIGDPFAERALDLFGPLREHRA